MSSVVAVGVNTYTHWMAIYPLDTVIQPLVNWAWRRMAIVLRTYTYLLA